MAKHVLTPLIPSVTHRSKSWLSGHKTNVRTILSSLSTHGGGAPPVKTPGRTLLTPDSPGNRAGRTETHLEGSQ